MSLDVGMTMITLDCSEHIDNAAADADIADLRRSIKVFLLQSVKSGKKNIQIKV